LRPQERPVRNNAEDGLASLDGLTRLHHPVCNDSRHRRTQHYCAICLHSDSLLLERRSITGKCSDTCFALSRDLGYALIKLSQATA